MPSEQDSTLLRTSTIYGLLQHSAAKHRSLSAVVAITSAQPKSGVTYTTRLLVDSLNQDNSNSAIYVDGRELSNSTLLTDGESVFADSDLETSSRAKLQRQSWRSSPALRKAYVSAIRERCSYVLIDCPSTAESSDVLLLAPNIDGIISVVEADVTTKTQISHLELSIQRSNGTILGHVLNKRKYVIPEWLHKKFQAIGV